jgi:hypothetical protein
MGENKRQPTIEYVDLPGDEIPEAWIFSPKWYLMGFPKSGTHLLESLMRPFVHRMPPTQLHPRQWVGTFEDNSWSDKWNDLQRTMYDFGQLRPGHYFLGHCGYREDLERFLYNLGIAFVMIYRDLRDVAVSQLHHCIDDNDVWTHPDKELYRAMSYDDALAAVITGVGKFTGLLDRWELYAPWLKVDWVLNVKYEDILADPGGEAKNIVEYGLARLAGIWDWKLHAPGPGLADLTHEMAKMSRDTDKSPTFRRGVSGGWRDVFKPRHCELFKQYDRNNWLVRLGYEEGPDW